MAKDRLAAFTDAVVAIIMTILVLELDRPAAMTLEGLLDLRGAFVAYALSFFWLGAFWASHHSIWQQVERVDTAVVWVSLLILFFLSFVPYTTGIVAENFDSSVAQGFHGAVIFASTLCNIWLNRRVARANAGDAELARTIDTYCRSLAYDCVIKFVALVLAVTVWPPAMMVGVLAAAAFIFAARAWETHR